MSRINPDNFKGNEGRSAQELATAILTLPLELEQFEDGQCTTFKDVIEVCCYIDRGLDQAELLEIYGVKDFLPRAGAVLDVVQSLAEGKQSLSQPEKKALQDSLIITAALLKDRKERAQISLEHCQEGEKSFAYKLGGGGDLETFRSQHSAEYYAEKKVAESLEKDIPPLFNALADKLNISLDSPGRG